MYTLDTESLKWQEITCLGAMSIPLVYHQICQVKNHLVLSGGEGFQRILNPAVYRFDFGTYQIVFC